MQEFNHYMELKKICARTICLLDVRLCQEKYDEAKVGLLLSSLRNKLRSIQRSFFKPLKLGNDRNRENNENDKR